MEMKLFGRYNGERDVFLYTIENEDCRLTLTNIGASIYSLSVFSREVVCGFDTLDGYIKDKSSQGAVVGRVAGRIENAELEIDGALYMLTANQNGHCLHGGLAFDRRIWDFVSADDKSVTFSCFSPDGEEGFPANLLTRVTYTLIGTSVKISYSATPDAKTPICLTNHSYFNLNKIGTSVLNHKLKIYASTYTETEKAIPTGRRPGVSGTYLDFRAPRLLSDGLPDGASYDHNFHIEPSVFYDGLALCAEVWGDDLKLSAYTDQPCVLLFCSTFLAHRGGDFFRNCKEKLAYEAFCLETQTEPNCVKRGEAIYDAGEEYTHNTIYKFEKI